MNSKAIQITELDFDRLKKLIEEASHTYLRGRDYLAHLQAELERAQVVRPQSVSDVVITMNSTVVLLDMDTQQEETCTLVFPENADADRGYISILAPIGMAMMGYQVGDTFEWPVPDGDEALARQGDPLSARGSRRLSLVNQLGNLSACGTNELGSLPASDGSLNPE